MQKQYTIDQPAHVELQARDLEPGTWVRIAWIDAEPAVALFLEYTGGSKRDGSYPKNFKGDRSINCFYPNSRSIYQTHDSAVHTQVIEIIGRLQAPE